jgi:plastocyanin
MTARKQIKKQHRLMREEQLRAAERSHLRRLVLGITASALIVCALIAAALAVQPWSRSSDADESLPSVALTIGDNFFRPDTIRVKAGQKSRVDLRNQGIATHDIWFAGNDNQSNTGDDVRSDPISGGGAASVQIKYDKPGTYYFVCTFHAGQGGTVVVEQPATPERSPQ